MRAFGALLILCISAPAVAQSVVVSDAPSSTSVTVYRDSDRAQGTFNLRWLAGYALISEKRRITLPVGESVVRFEGVADGMIAVSAVVSGLPGGIEEKNRDARLLSPASLLDGSLGNRVHIRRTNRQTGKVSETDAIVRSGPDNAVVLETPEGIEALRCSGLPETLVYDAVPDGLSAKPTFSVHTNMAQAASAEVTLTYLATGFDWGASYVAKVAEDGKTLDLFAWLTVANGNNATYEQTQLLAVAGKPNRTSDFRELAGSMQSPHLNLQCWPMDSTSTHPESPMEERMVAYDMAMAPAPPPMAMMRAAKEGNIVVTAQAKQEDLGDLKLYRVPMRVDVVPNAHKQVALMQKENVPFTLFYAADISLWNDDEGSQPLTRMIRMQNREKAGLGLPLPSGGIVVMQRQRGEEMLLADGDMADKTIGDKVEVGAGISDQLRYTLTERGDAARDHESYRLDLTNATDSPAAVEIKLGIDDEQKPRKSSAKLVRQDGRWMWKTTVPANGSASLSFSVKDR
tara:strand:- start:3241 stop:4785 length:1545 start_codon:yes stop_codon:yes gene_type:complete